MAQPEWPSLCLDHRQIFGFDHGMFDPGWILDMPGALRNARDDAGGLHELVCASGTKWLETRDHNALRATHGSQRLLMLGKTSIERLSIFC